MSFGHSAEKAGQGEVGGCTRGVQTAWLALGGPLLSVLLSMNRLEKQSYHLARCQFLAGKLFFPVLASGCWPRAVTIASLLMGGCGLGHKHVEDGCKSNCVKLGDGINLRVVSPR